MPKLPLAVGIADAVTEADQKNRRLDVGSKADELLKEYPEADTSRAEIANVLQEEGDTAGVSSEPDHRD